MAPLSHYNLSIHINLLYLCVCIPIHLHTLSNVIWIRLLYLSRWNFNSVPGLCVCLTQAQPFYKHLFSISFVFQFIVSTGMRIHKFYTRIKWKNLPHKCGKHVLQWGEWQFTMTSTDITKAWMKNPGPNGMKHIKLW